MTQDEVIKLVETTKGISPFTRAFVFWLYRNGYVIISPKEIERMLLSVLKKPDKNYILNLKERSQE